MSLEDIKQRIKEAPISSVISRYISLTTKGKSVVGVCPFHDDHDPSMQVNDHKGLFMCFVCQTGGDAITFVEKFRKSNFIEAVKEIATLLGMDTDSLDSKGPPEKRMAKKVLNKAQLIYRKIAQSNQHEAFNQFVKDRQLRPETVQQFKIGLAPSQNALSEYLKSIPQKSDRELAIKMALETRTIQKSTRPGSDYFDTFRERVIFPVWDQYGQVIGFCGRSLKDYQKAKYLNSSESLVFNKKNHLFGLNFAKQHIREKGFCLLVEGHMDLIALHQAGFENSVAIMGIGLSDVALNLIKNLTHQFVLGLDNDSAGKNAMTRINGLCMDNGILPSVIDYSPYKDPDEFLVNLGPLELQKRIDNKKVYVDLLIEKTLPKEIPEIADQKLNILTSIFEILAPLGLDLLATERVISIAKQLGLKSTAEQIIQYYENFLSERPKASGQYNKTKVLDTPQIEKKPELPMPQEDIIITSDENIIEESQQVGEPNSGPSRQEIFIIKQLITHPQCLLLEELDQALEFVYTNEVKSFILELKKLVYEIDDSEITSFLKKILDGENYSLELREAMGATLFERPQVIEFKEKKGALKLIHDLTYRLKQDDLKNKKSILKNKQTNITTVEELNSLMKEVNQIDREMSNLKRAQSQQINRN
jgi:DNA primase